MSRKPFLAGALLAGGEGVCSACHTTEQPYRYNHACMHDAYLSVFVLVYVLFYSRRSADATARCKIATAIPERRSALSRQLCPWVKGPDEQDPKQ